MSIDWKAYAAAVEAFHERYNGQPKKITLSHQDGHSVEATALLHQPVIFIDSYDRWGIQAKTDVSDLQELWNYYWPQRLSGLIPITFDEQGNFVLVPEFKALNIRPAIADETLDVTDILQIFAHCVICKSAISDDIGYWKKLKKSNPLDIYSTIENNSVNLDQSAAFSCVQFLLSGKLKYDEDVRHLLANERGEQKLFNLPEEGNPLVIDTHLLNHDVLKPLGTALTPHYAAQETTISPARFHEILRSVSEWILKQVVSKEACSFTQGTNIAERKLQEAYNSITEKRMFRPFFDKAIANTVIHTHPEGDLHYHNGYPFGNGRNCSGFARNGKEAHINLAAISHQHTSKTLAEELTHCQLQQVYQNNAKPFPKPDGTPEGNIRKFLWSAAIYSEAKSQKHGDSLRKELRSGLSIGGGYKSNEYMCEVPAKIIKEMALSGLGRYTFSHLSYYVRDVILPDCIKDTMPPLSIEKARRILTKWKVPPEVLECFDSRFDPEKSTALQDRREAAAHAANRVRKDTK